MVTVEGYVEKIVYRNEENGYTVLSVTVEEDELTCVGSFAFVNEGEYLRMEGDYSAHSVYGEQFKVSSYETIQPEDEIAIARYLASGAIKGVGEALAARIVKKFGADTFRIIEDEPERLVEIKGISKNKAQEIFKQFYEKKELRSAMIFLQQYGISMNLAVKIQQYYGQRMYEVINTNPYFWQKTSAVWASARRMRLPSGSALHRIRSIVSAQRFCMYCNRRRRTDIVICRSRS